MPHVVGSFAGVQALLHRAEDAAVAVDGFLVYPDLVEFRLRGRTHRLLDEDLAADWPRDARQQRERLERISALTNEAQQDFSLHVLPAAGPGGTFTGAHTCELVDREPEDPVLAPASWAGNVLGGSWIRHFRLSPVPPPSAMTVVIQWPSAGVPSGRAVIDTAALHRAKDEVLKLWPQQPVPGRWHTVATTTPRPTRLGPPAFPGLGRDYDTVPGRPQVVGQLADIRTFRSEVVAGPLGRERYVFVFHGFVCDPEGVQFRMEVAQELPLGRRTPPGQRRDPDAPDASQVEVRVVFSDGTSAVSHQGQRQADAGPAQLSRSGSTWSRARRAGARWQQTDDLRFSLAPLPPAGPVILAVAWPEVGIEETHTVIDGRLLRDAANEAWQL